MRLGDMRLCNLKSKVSPGDEPVRRRFQHLARKLTALTLMLLGGALLLGVVTGLGEDKTPKARTVSGVVLDEAENPIQGAAVKLKDLQTGKELEIYSQEEGQYQYNDLRFDHDYTIKAIFKDSSSEERRISMFETRSRLVLNLTIPKPNK